MLNLKSTNTKAGSFFRIKRGLEKRYTSRSLELANFSGADQDVLVAKLESLKTSYRRHKKLYPRSGSGKNFLKLARGIIYFVNII